MRHLIPFPLAPAVVALAMAASTGVAFAADPQGFLETIRRHTTLTSTVPDNGDQNPYAVVVAPASAGVIQKDDVLVTNFNNSTNLQGLGTTIVVWRPSTRKLSLLAQLPRTLPQCPGGIGLGTAMIMLKTGWVIVGSTPSTDGTTKTIGKGCLLVVSPQGHLVGTLTGADIAAPWGNMAVIDHGATASLFVSNAGFDVGPPVNDAPVVNRANVLRIDLSIPAGQPPVVSSQTVIGSGFGEQPDPGVFLIGPTGLALGHDDTLYVTDTVSNRITAISDASTRTTSAGVGRVITQDGLLQHPLAMVMAPNGHLLTTNGQNGKVVEVDPIAGKQIYARWIDANKAQSPPGSGDLFGIAMTPEGDGFYYVEDEVNTLVLAK